MRKRNPYSPWNPNSSVEVTPEEYEKQVVSWLRTAGEHLTQFEVNHLEHLAGPGGEYEFDAIAEFTILNGARIVVLVECKRYNRPVERDHVMTLWAKLQDVNAHKAMIFSTCGFQEGALDYARSKNIATVIFVAGDFLYETKALDAPSTPPPWVHLPKFAAIFVTREGGTIASSTVYNERIEPLSEWLFDGTERA
ncbi:MAG: restriction endonuclease [Deltaproteobacteria bacterium]|nr:restriction endonuclease [Deltaproteobacteria bacterium]